MLETDSSYLLSLSLSGTNHGWNNITFPYSQSNKLELYRQQVREEGEVLATLEEQHSEMKQAWFVDCRRRADVQILANKEAFDTQENERLTRKLIAAGMTTGGGGAAGAKKGGGAVEKAA